jgi:hypothetical protein
MKYTNKGAGVDQAEKTPTPSAPKQTAFTIPVPLPPVIRRPLGKRLVATSRCAANGCPIMLDIIGNTIPKSPLHA